MLETKTVAQDHQYFTAKKRTGTISGVLEHLSPGAVKHQSVTITPVTTSSVVTGYI